MKFININISEKLIFLIFCLVNLLPILFGLFTPTMDGAAHLYNSQLVLSLLGDNNELLQSTYAINTEPVPNWSGHIILAFFNLFLPAYLAEKTLLIIYLIGLPYAFRYLILQLNPSNKIVTYFIFPFTYTYLFLLGFYNFSLALVFMFVAAGYWIKFYNSKWSYKNIVILFVLILSTYFSHIFVFAILMILIGIQVLWTSFYNMILDKEHIKNHLIIGIKKTFLITLISLPFLILFMLYFQNRNGIDNYTYIETNELFNWIIKFRPALVFSEMSESPINLVISYTLGAILIITIFVCIKNIHLHFRRNVAKTKTFFSKNDYWLVVIGIITILLFTLPDSDGSAGYVSIRLVLFLFLFCLVWIGTKKIPTGIQLLALVIFSYASFKINKVYLEFQFELNEIAEDCHRLSKHIEPNSVVLPLNFSGHWITGHFSNYLGVDKPMIILENYECSVGYFPIIWNDKKFPNFTINNLSADQFDHVSWKSNPINPQKAINYIFILGPFIGFDTPRNKEVELLVKNHCELVESNKNAHLYRIK